MLNPFRLLPPVVDPTVTVVLLTYNHEAFIAEAIESILMQETEFRYEIVIVEDCSVDSTREIIKYYRDIFPDVIRLELADTNQNNWRSWGQAILSAKGKYVALLEGDDYWTSPHKLQRQVDYLNAHHYCTSCFHKVKLYIEGKDEEQDYLKMPYLKEIYTLEDIIASNFIGTASVMFRAGIVENYPKWFYELPFGDWPLHIFLANRGSIGYINESMAVYRIHSGGVWSQRSDIQVLQARLPFYDYVDSYLEYEYTNKIHALRNKCYLDLGNAYCYSGHALKASKFAIMCMANNVLSQSVPILEILNLIKCIINRMMHCLLRLPFNLLKSNYAE